MRKQLLSLVLLAGVAFSSTSVYAGARNTPVEVFINHEMEEQTFVPVSGLWEADNISHSGIDQKVSGAAMMRVNFSMLTELIQRPVRDISLEVPNGNGGVFTIELARFDFLSQGFQVYNRNHGVETPVVYTPGVYYRGVVKGMPGSVAAFSFYDNQVSGVFSIPGAGNFVLGQHTVGTGEQGHYVLYNDMNLKSVNDKGKCGIDALPEFPGNKTAGKNTFNSCKDVELFLMADFQTYSDFGSSTTNVANYLINLYNMVATLYRNEGIYTSIKAISVNTSSDVYDILAMTPNVSSHDYLYEFGDDIQNNLHGADLAMLVSTVNLGLGGVAWLDALCASYSGTGGHGPYSFCGIHGDWGGSVMPTFSWDIEVMTHEMGHNYGSPHTHACVWNGNMTAIDGCYTVEGNCGNPGTPPAGGTIMSYCHLAQGVGINLANGFGPQPGDVIRDGINNAPCATLYLPGKPATSKLKTITANRECTDDNNVTYYWNDNNNANEDDDVLALKIRKAGSNIGNLDDGTLTVKNSTTLNYSNGSGAGMSMPAGVPVVLGTNIGANRAWKVTPTKQPLGEVEVIFPFTKQDLTDIDGSVPASLTASDLLVYSVNNTTVDATPSTNLGKAAVADLSIYTNGASASMNNWSIETKGDTLMAHFNVKKLVGGSVFYSYSQNPQSVQSIYEEGKATFFPNPTSNNWNVWVPNSGNNIHLSLYTVDGRVVAEQQLQGGALNEVHAQQLAAGLYYYRISSETVTYTGTLQKN